MSRSSADDGTQEPGACPGGALAVHLPHHRGELDGAEIEIRAVAQVGIDGRKVVVAVDLQTVSGVVEQRDIGALKRL